MTRSDLHADLRSSDAAKASSPSSPSSPLELDLAREQLKVECARMKLRECELACREKELSIRELEATAALSTNLKSCNGA
eukprot:957114-Rhodomonas_salina.1